MFLLGKVHILRKPGGGGFRKLCNLYTIAVGGGGGGEGGRGGQNMAYVIIQERSRTCRSVVSKTDLSSMSFT